MKENKKTLIVICAILFIFTAADLICGDSLFSQTENRILASRPEISVKTVLDGSYMKDYENYVTDQFVGRDKWIGIKTASDIVLQKKEINGVYLGSDGYLIEQHLKEDYPQDLTEQRISLLNSLAEKWNAKIMLVPTADNILTDKLPAYTEDFDQEDLLRKVEESVGTERYIDVYNVLLGHADEAIYYRTDHHWTSRGAYYGYVAWADNMGEMPKVELSDLKDVSDSFLGTTHSKINLPVRADTIEYFPSTEQLTPQIIYDLQTKSDSFYEESHLDTKNKYGYFLDDNHAFIEIDTGIQNGRTLFVIKDSYANCMIPLLAFHYEKIYVTDLRYMNNKLFPFMESYEPESGMDVLVLYNCIHFLEDFKYW